MAEAKRKSNRHPQPNNPDELIAHNCHFSQNVLEIMRLHAALTQSGGVSGLVRTVMECYLADAISFDDPRYVLVERIARPKERYRGQHKRLGLA